MVRRKAPDFRGASLIALVTDGGTAATLRMFAFGDALIPWARMSRSRSAAAI